VWNNRLTEWGSIGTRNYDAEVWHVTVFMLVPPKAIFTGWKPIWGTIMVNNRKLADCHNIQFYFFQHNTLEKLPGERIGTVTSEVWFDSVSSANKCYETYIFGMSHDQFLRLAVFPCGPSMCLAPLTKLHCIN
jgi:hypothetical protein